MSLMCVSLALLLGAITSSCGHSQAELDVRVDPDPIPVLLSVPCAAVSAMFFCSNPSELASTWTVVASTRNDIGGSGHISVTVADAASRQPLPDQGVLSGELNVALGPRGRVTLPVVWKRPVPQEGPDRVPPAQLAFVISVELTDTLGNRVRQTATVLEKLPRNWEIF